MSRTGRRSRPEVGDDERSSGRRWDGPGVQAWHPWSPNEVASRLGGVALDWCVVGGQSIDLFLGEQTRVHLDLEIAIQRADLPAVREQLSDVVFHTVVDGSVRRLALDEPGPLDRHQHWGLDERAGAWRIDVMVEPGDSGTWIYRRVERVRAPRDEMVGRTADGIPYLRPHGALLYKAASPSSKDEADLQAVIGRLDPDAKAWLAASLDRLHPDHPWRARLG